MYVPSPLLLLLLVHPWLPQVVLTQRGDDVDFRQRQSTDFTASNRPLTLSERSFDVKIIFDVGIFERQKFTNVGKELSLSLGIFGHHRNRFFLTAPHLVYTKKYKQRTFWSFSSNIKMIYTSEL